MLNLIPVPRAKLWFCVRGSRLTNTSLFSSKSTSSNDDDEEKADDAHQRPAHAISSSGAGGGRQAMTNQPAVSGTEVFRVCTNVFMHFYNSAGRLQGLKAHLSHLYLQGLLGWAGLGWAPTATAPQGCCCCCCCCSR